MLAKVCVISGSSERWAVRVIVSSLPWLRVNAPPPDNPTPALTVIVLFAGETEGSVTESKLPSPL